ncbi:MAG: zinc ribbon domain-containing protein [Candidatus Neomarinimicrobiota bacterium]
MQHANWQCPKCKNKDFETDQFAATGGGFSKIFDIQNKKFTTVTCTRCKYTEIYKAGSGSTLENVFDFLTD